MNYAAKWPMYAAQWDRMVINPNRVAEFEAEARFAVAHKDIYMSIQTATTHDIVFGVSWPLIAVLHRRESNAEFSTYLGNGQLLSRRTTIEPRGRGPFNGPDAFLNGALDALHIDGLDAVRDWRLEKELFYTELFNGPGYDHLGLPDPYVWGGTNIQKPGKYIRDHVFDHSVMDTQPGCAPLLWMIAKLDPSVTFQRETT